MPSVTSSPAKKKTDRPAGSDWDEISIRHAEGGGFIISKCMDYVPGKAEQKRPLPYPATEPGSALDYLEKCLGSKEHYAHESAEGHPEAAKGKKS